METGFETKLQTGLKYAHGPRGITFLNKHDQETLANFAGISNFKMAYTQITDNLVYTYSGADRSDYYWAGLYIGGGYLDGNYFYRGLISQNIWSAGNPALYFYIASATGVEINENFYANSFVTACVKGVAFIGNVLNNIHTPSHNVNPNAGGNLTRPSNDGYDTESNKNHVHSHIYQSAADSSTDYIDPDLL